MFAPTVVAQPPVTYQWRFNGVKIPGATNSVYTLSNAQYTNAGSYFVCVTNNGGFAVSSNATLAVINTPLRFIAVGWNSSGFTGRLDGPVLATYVLSVSTNLKDWTPIATNLTTTGSWDFSDPQSASRPLGLYRAVVQ